MAYSILVSSLARQDILATADYIREHGNKERAANWKNELVKAIGTLKEMPNRCSVADESAEVGRELRELHFRSHRVIFAVDESTNTVQILRVYHGARAPLRVEDLE